MKEEQYMETDTTDHCFQGTSMATITDQIVTEVSKRIGFKWNALGRQLGYEDEELEKFGSNQPDLPDMCTQMLDSWKAKCGANPSIKDLVDSLKAIDRTDLAEKIENENKVTNKIIKLISKKIGCQWSNLARELDFGPAEIDEFKNPLNKAYREIVIKILNEWVQRENEAATVHELSAKLVSVDRKDIADEIGKSTDKVSEDQIERVARKIGNTWRPLGRKLGYTEENLDNYENTGSKTLEESCRKMLKAWQKKVGKKATEQKLIECLLAIDRKDLAETIGGRVDLK